VAQAAVTAAPVRVVSFTGSTAAGRAVGALGGEQLKRTHLELGGNNALIVLPGADLDLASSAGAFGSFMHQGQICMTTGRHLVHASVDDEYVAALATRADHLPVGNPATSEVALGPIIDAKQVQHIDALVQRTVDSRCPAGRRRNPRGSLLPADGPGRGRPGHAGLHRPGLRAGGPCGALQQRRGGH